MDGFPKPIDVDEEISADAIKKIRDISLPFLRNTNKGFKKPMKLLCLHGHGANNDITRIQLASIGLYQKVELDIIHGKYECNAEVPAFQRLSKEPFWSWWDIKTPTSMYKVLMSLVKTIERHGPYDGLFGFSQGSLFVSLLSSPDIAESLGITRSWSFVIIAGGYFGVRPIIKEMLQKYGKSVKMPLKHSLKIPSLHILGRHDKWGANSVEQIKLYDSPSVVYHDYGHGLPKALLKDANLQAAVSAFMTQRSMSKL